MRPPLFSLFATRSVALCSFSPLIGLTLLVLARTYRSFDLPDVLQP
jgi:hypothetical protein